MFKFVQFNQTKRYVAQKFCSFLCNFTCYKSVTKILQNGYKWLQTCNHTNSAGPAGAIRVLYVGRAGIYARKGAVNELRLGAASGATLGAAFRIIFGAAFRIIFGATFGSCVWEL